jgi:hypothetical protein
MVKAALHTYYLASKCWWLSQESIQFQIYVFRRDFIECPACYLYHSARTPAYCIFLLSLLPNNTSFYYLSDVRNTVSNIAQHFTRISPAFLQLTFIAADDVLTFELLCSLALTHISYGADIEETISIWQTARQRALNWSCCCCCFSLSHPSSHLNAAREMYFKIDPSFWNAILYNVV